MQLRRTLGVYEIRYRRWLRSHYMLRMLGQSDTIMCKRSAHGVRIHWEHMRAPHPETADPASEGGVWSASVYMSVIPAMAAVTGQATV